MSVLESETLREITPDLADGSSPENAVATLNAAYEALPQGGTIVLYTDQESLQTAAKVTVPNFVGYTAMEVNGVAAEYGLNVSFTGAVSAGGIAAAQSIAEGTQVAQGTVISITFAANTEGGSSD